MDVVTPSQSTYSSEQVVPVGSDEPLPGRSEAGLPATGAAGDGDASFVQTCFNGLNALTGVGLLSVPYAVSEGGWLSLVLFAVVAIVCWYTGILLQRCMAVDPAVRTFADIGERAFGRRRGRVLVAGFMHAELYLIAIGFLILDGDNLEKLFPGARVRLGAVTLAGKRLFVVLVALVVAPTTWLRSLGVLAYLSATGVFASVLIVVSVLWTGAVDGVGFSAPGATLMRPAGLPTTLGLFTFCFCGHCVFPTIYTSMKEKRRFPKMLAICFALCSLNYGSMAVVGYLMYGAGVQSQVTLNLPRGRVSSKIAIVTTIVSPLSKYALVVTPIATAIEERILRRGATGSGVAVSMAVRTLLVLSTVAVALAVPFFGYLMALVGSLLSVGACVMLPCVCYLRMFGKPARAAEAAAIAAILVLSSVLLVTGTYSSVRHIIHELTA